MTVPDDVGGSPGSNAWEAGLRWWDLAFAGSLILVATLAIVDRHLDTARTAATLALAAALAGWYLFNGAKALRCDSSTARYIAGAAVIFVAMVAVFPASGVMLYVLCAQSFALLELRWGILAVVVLESVTAASQLANFGLHAPNVTAVVSWFDPTLLMGCLLGAFIHRIIAESSERAGLIAQLHEARAGLAVASRDAGVLQERERLAREIHDTLAQGFTSLVLLVRAAGSEIAAGDLAGASRHLDLAERTARENLAEARSLVAAKAPAGLEDHSLPEALRRLTSGLDADGIAAGFEVSGMPRPLGASLEVTAYRVAQEALTNVRRHAGAHSVGVRLSYCADETSLEVCDDGCGFQAPGSGFGLAGMKARAADVGGRVEVTSGPGTGTTVRLLLPFAAGTAPGATTATAAGPGALPAPAHLAPVPRLG
ncbi:MAG: sensor histidine kinase [Acidimicrobiales bacterium]